MQNTDSADSKWLKNWGQFLECKQSVKKRENSELHNFCLYVLPQIKSDSKKPGQHWHCNCNFGINVLANSCFIFQIFHAKTFKMRYIRCLYNNPIQNIHKNAWKKFFMDLPIRWWCPKFAIHKNLKFQGSFWGAELV